MGSPVPGGGSCRAWGQQLAGTCPGWAQPPLHKQAAAAANRPTDGSWSQAHMPPLWPPFQGWAGQRETKGAWPHDTEPGCSSHSEENHSPAELCGHRDGRLKELLCSGRHWRSLSPEEAPGGRERGCFQGALKKKPFFQARPPAVPTRPQGHIHRSEVLWCLASPGSSPSSAPCVP